jgi:hypothetical protein
MKTRLEYVLKAGIYIPQREQIFLLAIPIGPTLMSTQYYAQCLPVTFFFGNIAPRV